MLRAAFSKEFLRMQEKMMVNQHGIVLQGAPAVENHPTPLKWDIMSAVCVERKPIIAKSLNDVEQSFQKVVFKMEFERSLKSDQELRHETERVQAELLRRGEPVDMDIDQSVKQTTLDFADYCHAELARYLPASRKTEADLRGDTRSLERKLDEHLILLIQQKLGDKYQWLLPQGLRQDGETMRQTAERVLKENCGDDLRVRFWGNAPCGFYKYKYPLEHQKTPNDAVGAKVFFFKAIHLSGNVKRNKSILKDFKWSCRDELPESLRYDYCKSVSQFLIYE